MTAENNFTLAEFNARNNAALNELIATHGVQVKRFSDDVMNAIGEAAGQVVADAAAGDPLTGRIYNSFIDFRRNAIAWSRFSDQAFWEARLLPFRYERT